MGNYSYNGNLGNSYANPHAVTSAGTMQYEYDHNGNMISAGSPMGLVPVSYAWDYNNRLQSVTNGDSVFSYAYDADGQRVISNDSMGQTLSITKEYSLTPNNAEKHIFLGDTAIATVSGSNETAAPLTIHADHLTGSNVVTNSNQAVDELTDYYAFGTMRIEEQNGSHEEKRKFTGHELDRATGLTYANARYYDATLGRWITEDSVFLSIANQKEVEGKAQMQYMEYLANPQVLNSYAYVANNPLKYKDQTGDFLFLVVPIIVYAPVWIPIVITASAAAGAGVATWYEAHAINNLAHGNTTSANKNMDKVETALNITGIGVGGVMGAEQYLVKAGGTSSVGVRPNKQASQAISRGHGYNDHIDEFRDLGISTKNQYQKYIEKVMDHPTEVRFLERGRTAYWYGSTETIVIKDPSSRDMGTSFRPSLSRHSYNTNYEYFKKGLDY